MKDFNDELKHFGDFLKYIPHLGSVGFLNMYFNSQIGHLLAYLREERGIEIDIRLDEEDYVYNIWDDNGIIRDIANPEYNKGLQAALIIGMNHES